MRIYLSEEAVPTELISRMDKSPSLSLEQYKGTYYHRDIYGWYIEGNHLLDGVPMNVANCVVKISIHERIDTPSPRANGVYHYGTATAVVDRDGANHYQWVDVRGPNCEETIKLYNLIRAGKTAPIKDEGWDGPQGSEPVQPPCPPRQNFRQWMGKQWQILADTVSKMWTKIRTAK